MKRVTRLAFWLIALASVGLGVQVLSNSTGLPGAAAGRPPTRVTGFYLAIGASASLGTQPNGVSSHNGYRSKTGYTSDVAAIEARKGVALDLAPIGCPAETAQSMLSGTDKCYKPPNRQMTVATKYLHEHATKVGLVTIDLGFNNVRPCLWPTVNRACVASGIAMVVESIEGRGWSPRSLHRSALRRPLPRRLRQQPRQRRDCDRESRGDDHSQPGVDRRLHRGECPVRQHPGGLPEQQPDARVDHEVRHGSHERRCRVQPVMDVRRSAVRTRRPPEQRWLSRHREGAGREVA
jgi:hypothetical protein